TGFDALDLVDEDIPRPEAGQVLVRVRASSLNFRDPLIARGEFPFPASPDHAPGRQPGRRSLQAAAQTLRSALPDMTSTVTHMPAEGDLIAVRKRVTGTQHGPLGEL